MIIEDKPKDNSRLFIKPYNNISIESEDVKNIVKDMRNIEQVLYVEKVDDNKRISKFDYYFNEFKNPFIFNILHNEEKYFKKYMKDNFFSVRKFEIKESLFKCIDEETDKEIYIIHFNLTKKEKKKC